MDAASHQIPPHSEPAERAVLGCAVAAAERFLPLLITLAVDDFYLPQHRELWACIKAIWDRSMPVDIVSIQAEIAARDTGDRFPQAGDWLVALSGDAAYWEHLPSHRAIVESKSTLRRIIQLCSNVMAEAYHGADAADVASSLRTGLVDVEASGAQAGPRPLTTAIPEAMERIQDKAAHPQRRGMTTGSGRLDELIGLLQPGQMWTVGGGPGMGKSAFGLGITMKSAEAGLPAILISLEMSTDEIVGRILSRRTGVPSKQLASGDAALNSATWSKVIAASGPAAGLPIWIETTARKLTQIKAAIRRWHIQHVFGQSIAAGVVIVDYLQLIIPEGNHERRDLEVAHMTRELKSLAMDLSIPIVVLSQLNREGRRDNARPTLSALRESGAIEQDSDVVIFPWRETETSTEALLICAKNRNGPCGSVACAWDGPTMVFSDF